MKIKKLSKTVVCVLMLFVSLSSQTMNRPDYFAGREGFRFIDSRELGFLNENAYKIQIWGEVRQPGVYIVPDYATLIDVISIAGGPLPEADLDRIRIINPRPADGTKQAENELIISLEYFLQKGKFRTEPEIGDETIIIVSKNKKSKFFDSLPRILNVLNIFSVGILLYSWLK
jgi:hypothetical protein